MSMQSETRRRRRRRDNEMHMSRLIWLMNELTCVSCANFEMCVMQYVMCSSVRSVCMSSAV